MGLTVSLSLKLHLLDHSSCPLGDPPTDGQTDWLGQSSCKWSFTILTVPKASVIFLWLDLDLIQCPSLFNRATVTILRPAISLSLFVLSSLSSDILALKQESRIVRKFRDVSKVSTVFLSGSLALPLLLFSVQILAWKCEVWNSSQQYLIIILSCFIKSMSASRRMLASSSSLLYSHPIYLNTQTLQRIQEITTLVHFGLRLAIKSDVIGGYCITSPSLGRPWKHVWNLKHMWQLPLHRSLLLGNPRV